MISDDHISLNKGKVKGARERFKGVLKKSYEIEQNDYESQVLDYEELGKVYERNEKWIDTIAIYHFSLLGYGQS